MKIGIDLGSRQVKLAFQNAGEQGWRFARYDTIEFYRDYAALTDRGLALNLAALGLPEPSGIVACGYGRQSVAVAGGRSCSEIEAHAAGACAQSGERDFLLLDLGGQDSKVVKVQDGRVADFLTNDKCAAGSGRYLENMAIVLGLTIEELAVRTDDPEPLSATCAVFGESELIGKIIAGVPVGRLAASVNQTVVKRILPLVNRFLPAEKIFFCGGVAQNQAVAALLAASLGREVRVLPHPQFNGAIGCCVKSGV
ncbi:MAG: acyl-CoA dehydratase activase [Clostridiales bacterium]|nr:acyl-CoA dehydratase activase [Clostridiales bacterium]